MSNGLYSYCLKFPFAVLWLLACTQSLSATSQAAEQKTLSIRSKTGSLHSKTYIKSAFASTPDNSSKNRLLAQSSDNAWLKVKQAISIDEIANAIGLSTERIAAINEVPKNHKFKEGDWFATPRDLMRKIENMPFIDQSNQVSKNPPQHPAPLEEFVLARSNDSLDEIAKRSGVPIAEILRLNPGLESARLVVGSLIRVRQSNKIHHAASTINDDLNLIWPENGKLVALVGPFKRNAASFASYLNAHKGGWEDPSMRVYFFDLYQCSSIPSFGDEGPDGYSCKGGYVRISDNLGARTCKLSNVEWARNSGISFSPTMLCK